MVSRPKRQKPWITVRGVYRHGVGTAAVVLGFVVWALSWAIGIQFVADAMEAECRDSPCFVSAPEEVQVVAWVLALLPAVIAGVLLVVLWRRYVANTP